jgi:hypothetical protein
MSADLFAEFGNLSAAPAQAEQKQQNSVPATGDPFSFLSSNSASPYFQAPAPNSQHNPLQSWRSQSQTQPSQSSWPGLSNGTSKGPGGVEEAEEEEDGWGDFETASTVAPQAATQTSVSQPAARRDATSNTSLTSIGNYQRARPPPVTRIVRASTLDLISNNLVDTGDSPAQAASPPLHNDAPKPQSQLVKERNHDPSVLFDADDFDGEEVPEEEDDDDFGDFESVPARAAPVVDLFSPAPDVSSGRKTNKAVTATRASDLLSGLSLMDEEPPLRLPHTQLQSPPFTQTLSSNAGLQVRRHKVPDFLEDAEATESNPPTAWPAMGSWEVKDDSGKKDGGFFDDWDTAAKTTPLKQNQQDEVPPSDIGWEWDAVDDNSSSPQAQSDQPPRTSQGTAAKLNMPHGTGASTSSQQEMLADETGLPPTNIPPPAIILSLFPQLLDLAETALFKPLGTQSASIKDRVLSDPRSYDFLRAYLLLTTVAARIIAGRKQRWHRDKFLSQSMSISAAGGKGGMKLAGIDKSQAAREDREAADVLEVWAGNVGKLRNAVAAANGASTKDKGQQLKVPELSSTMAVQTLRGAETAAKACFLCGLKREERIVRVDFDVEDSFHEWWVDHWGHRACRNFWIEHEAALRQH